MVTLIMIVESRGVETRGDGVREDILIGHCLNGMDVTIVAPEYTFDHLKPGDRVSIESAGPPGPGS
jgi:uncharacterized protein (DUF2237 family)